MSAFLCSPAQPIGNAKQLTVVVWCSRERRQKRTGNKKEEEDWKNNSATTTKKKKNKDKKSINWRKYVSKLLFDTVSLVGQIRVS